MRASPCLRRDSRSPEPRWLFAIGPFPLGHDGIQHGSGGKAFTMLFPFVLLVVDPFCHKMVGKPVQDSLCMFAVFAIYALG